MKVGGILVFALVAFVHSIESANTPPRTPQSPGVSGRASSHRSSHSPGIVRTPPQRSPQLPARLRTPPPGSPYSAESSQSPTSVPEHSTVNYLKPYYDRGVKKSIIRVTCELTVDQNGYKELYYLNEHYQPEQIYGEFPFVIIGDTIVGLGYTQFIHPLLDRRGNIIIIKGAHRIEVTPEEAERHGVFRYYEADFAIPNHECPERIKYEPHDF